MYPTNTIDRDFRKSLRKGALTLAALNLFALCTSAQGVHNHVPVQQGTTAVGEQMPAGALLKIVRESTERFKDVSVAMKEGYVAHFGCVSGSESGAMGIHFVNQALVAGGVVDATRPQIIIYEPEPGGGLRLIGADYLVIAEAWNAKNAMPPVLMGQLFHLFESPNRFGLPAFYTLHVWAWKENPNGAFVNWHPKVSCASYTGDTM